jgi:hypothetical protein
MCYQCSVIHVNRASHPIAQDTRTWDRASRTLLRVASSKIVVSLGVFCPSPPSASDQLTAPFGQFTAPVTV